MLNVSADRKPSAPLPCIFEGGTGLHILRMWPGLRLPDFCTLDHPDSITGLHKAYADAGATVLKTLTFNANPYTLGSERELCRRICQAAVAHCRTAGAQAVAGNIGAVIPSGADPTIAHMAYRSQAQALVEAGADLLLVETITDARGAHVCLSGCTGAMNVLGRHIPLYINAVLPMIGADTLASLAAEYGCTAAGWNCSPADTAMQRSASELRLLSPGLRILLQPDGTADPAEPLAAWLEGGTADMAGGCCGTSPQTIERLTALLRSKYHKNSQHQNIHYAN